MSARVRLLVVAISFQGGLSSAPRFLGGRSTKGLDAADDIQQKITCNPSPHGSSLKCSQTTDDSGNITFTIPCPENAESVNDCLFDEARVCYMIDDVPCLSSYFCAGTGRVALDCSNLFAASTNDFCSAIDCNGDCISLADTPVDYASSVDARDNSCTGSGHSNTLKCNDTNTDCQVTNDWVDVLGDGTEIWVSASHSTKTNYFEQCSVGIVGHGPCSCSTDCSGYVVSYDCSEHSNDKCTIVDCEGNCGNELNGESSLQANSEPTTAPVESTVDSDVSARNGEPTSSPFPFPETYFPLITDAPVPPPLDSTVDSDVSAPTAEPTSSPFPDPETYFPLITDAPVPAPVRPKTPVEPTPKIFAPTTWGPPPPSKAPVATPPVRNFAPNTWNRPPSPAPVAPTPYLNFAPNTWNNPPAQVAASTFDTKELVKSEFEEESSGMRSYSVVALTSTLCASLFFLL